MQTECGRGSASQLPCLQARLPFSIGFFSQPIGGQAPWLHFCWKLGDSESASLQLPHEALVAICAQDVVPHTVSAGQVCYLAQLLKNLSLAYLASTRLPATLLTGQSKFCCATRPQRASDIATSSL